MKLGIAFLWLLSFQLLDEVPFKPLDEFDLKLDFEFKSRQLNTNSTVYTTENAPRNTGPLPFLALDLTILKLTSTEARIRIVDNMNETVVTKKVEVGSQLKWEMGFTDDLKGHANGFTYTVYFLTSEKKPESRIEIYFQEDGTFLVNGEKRGKI